MHYDRGSIPGSPASAILKLLKECKKGEGLTRVELASLLPDHSPNLIRQAVARLKSAKTRCGHPKRKRIYVFCWEHEDITGQYRQYPRAVYRLGANKDVPKPKSSPRSVRDKRYYDKITLHKRVGLTTPTSVFDLALKG